MFVRMYILNGLSAISRSLARSFVRPSSVLSWPLSSFSVSLSMLLCAVCLFVVNSLRQYVHDTTQCERVFSLLSLCRSNFFSIIHSFRSLKWLMNAARATIMRQIKKNNFSRKFSTKYCLTKFSISKSEYSLFHVKRKRAEIN